MNKSENLLNISFNKILETDNLAEILDDQQTAFVVSKVQEQFDIDRQSREEKQKVIEKILKLALLVKTEKSFPWAKASNVIYPLISTACVEFAAKCYPQIFKDGSIVKSKIIGNDMGFTDYDQAGREIVNPETGEPVLFDAGEKTAKGARVADYMNWQLRCEIQNFEEDMDALFHSLPAIGTMFKKVYECDDKVVDELVYPDKLIINDFAISLEKSVATHILEYYAQDVISNIRSGYFIDFEFDVDQKQDASPVDDYSQDMQDVGKGQSQAGLHIFLEQHNWIDLDGDGYPEPYIATVHQSTGKLVKLTKRFYKDDIKYNKEGEIESIKPQNFFVKYIFLPSPDGSFYGVGLGHLLLNINESVNTSINQLNDAGTLQNTGITFIAKSLKIAGGNKSAKLGELKQVEAFGGTIKDSIVSLPTPQPSQTLFELLNYLVNAGKELAALRDVMTGENAANVAPTTILAMVEQGYKQFKSVYKRIERAAAQEFQLINRINVDTVSLKKYAKVLGVDERKVSVKKDFDIETYDLVLVADADSINNMEKMAKANFLMSFLNDPNINRKLALQKIFAIAGVPDAEDLIIDAPQQMNPLMEVEQLKAEVKVQEIQAKVIDNNQKFELEKQKLITENSLLQYEVEKKSAEIEEIRSRSMLNLAQIGKTSKETEFMETKERLDIMDNEIDANIKERELQDKKEARAMDAQLKVMDMVHKGKTELAKMQQKEREAANSTNNKKSE